MADECDRREQAEDDGAETRERGDDRARLQRILEVGVREELVVPAERESAERERRQGRVVEREDEQDEDRGVQKRDDQGEEGSEQPRTPSREGDVHQSATTCRGWRKRAKTSVSAPTTRSRKSA